MSLTIDELVNAYNEASDDVASMADRKNLCPSGTEMGRAGIRAVVEHLQMEIAGRFTDDTVWKIFDEILGSAGEKATVPSEAKDDSSTACVSVADLPATPGQRLIKAANEAAAIARGEAHPAAVHLPAKECVWTLTNWSPDASWYERKCVGEVFERDLRHIACPSCGKPIKFKEETR